MPSGPIAGFSASVPGYAAQFYFAQSPGALATGGMVGETDELSLSTQLNVLDATSHQSGGWKTQKGGEKSWTATAKGLHLGADVTQVAFRAAVTGSVVLYMVAYPEGIGVGLTQQEGCCLIKDWKYTGAVKDLAKAEFSLEGTGPLVESIQTSSPSVFVAE